MTQPTYQTVRVTSDKLGNHLGGLRDLTQQLTDLLSNPEPGGLIAKRDELVGMIDQAQQMVDEATSKLNTLEALTGLLTQQLSVILGALDQVGFVRIEFGGPTGTVASEHAQAMSQIGSAQVYGFTLVATVPDAQAALKSLQGASAQVQTMFSSQPNP